MTTRSSKALAFVIPALLCSEFALAQAVVLKESEQKTERKAGKEAGKKPSPFSLEISAGLETDSNVSVSELDESTGEDDQAAVFEADLDYELALGESTELQFGYGLSQTSYDDFSEFDLQSSGQVRSRRAQPPTSGRYDRCRWPPRLRSGTRRGGRTAPAPRAGSPGDESASRPGPPGQPGDGLDWQRRTKRVSGD